MKKIATLTALFLASALLPVQFSAQVKVTQDADHVQVEIDGKPFTTFYLHEGEAMKPYLYPLRTASGKIITRHFPMEKVEGEPVDHPHHRGLWFGHEDVNGRGLWNNRSGARTVWETSR